MNDLLARVGDLDPLTLWHAAKLCSMGLGALLLVGGIVSLFWGSVGPLLRLNMGAVAAAVAWLWVPTFFGDGASFVPGRFVQVAAAASFGTLGLFWPAAAAFTLCALAGGRLTASKLPLSDPFLRALPGGLLAGIAGAYFARAVLASITSATGAIAVSVGGTALLRGMGWAAWIDDWPVVTLLPAALLSVTGLAMQLTRPASKPKALALPRPQPRLDSSGGGAA